MSRLTRYEQETIINFDEGEDTASIYTHKEIWAAATESGKSGNEIFADTLEIAAYRIYLLGV